MHTDPEFMEVTIEFDLPLDYRDIPNNDIVVEILGGFTEWCPMEMRLSPDSNIKYLYTVKLKRGYKHR